MRVSGNHDARRDSRMAPEGIRIAQDANGELSIGRREHKASRNNRTKAQNGKDKRGGPVTWPATMLSHTRSCFHYASHDAAARTPDQVGFRRMTEIEVKPRVLTETF